MSTPNAPSTGKTGLGIALGLLAMLMFSLNDTMGKWLVADYGVVQLMLIRSGAALLVICGFLLAKGVRPRDLVRVERPGLQFFRAFCATAEASFFYFAVITLPLADVMTYWLAAPIYVAALSPFLLGERIGWRRWTAIVVGFVGVVIALQPSAATLTPAALVSVVGSFLFGLFIVSGRQLRGTPDAILVFWQFLFGFLVTAVIAPFVWVAPSGRDFVLLALLGIVAMVAHASVSRALKLADAATVAPLQYTLLLWAILFGWLFFDEIPRAMTLVGAAVIVASGLFIAIRQKKVTGDALPLPRDAP